MKKTFTILIAALAAILMMAQPMKVWADNNPDVTYDFTGSDWTVSNGTLSNGTVSFTGAAGNASGSSFKMNSGYFIMGKSGAYLNFPTYSNAVSKIVITGRSGASGNVKQNIYVNETAVSTETTGATGTNTYEIATANQAAGTTYTLKVTSAHSTQITKIEIYYASGAGTTPSITADNVDILYTATGGSIAYILDDQGTTGTVTASVSSGNDWLSKGEGNNSPISVSCTVNPLCCARKATVRLTYTYNNGTQSVYRDVVVTQAANTTSGAAGSDADHPFTVAQARAAIDYNGNVTGVYARGIVCTASSNLFSGKYLSYWISADGDANSDKLEAYNGLGLDGEDFTSVNDVQVGATVVIYGNLTKFNSTYEFAADNYLVSYTAPVAPTITVDKNSLSGFTYEEGYGPSTTKTVAVSGSNLKASIGLSLGDNSNYEMCLTVDGTYTNSLTLTETSGTVSATNVYVRLKAGLEKSASNYTGTITLTSTNATNVTVSLTGNVTAYHIASLPFSFDDGVGAIAIKEGLTQENIGTDYSSSPKLRFDKGNKNDDGLYSTLVLCFDERPGTLTFDIKNQSFSDGTFKVQTSEDGLSYTDLKVYSEITGTQNEEFNSLGENVRYIKWIYTQKVNGNVALGNIALAKYVEPIAEKTLTLGELNHVNLLVFDDPNGDPIEFTNNEAQIAVGTTVYVSIEGVDEDCKVFNAIAVSNNVEITTIAAGSYYSFVMPNADATLTASTNDATQYALTVTGEHISNIELEANGSPATLTNICEQSSVVVNGFTLESGYTISSVTLTYGNISETVNTNTSNLYEFQMPSSNATLTFTTTEVTISNYTKVTSQSDLIPGKHYILVGYTDDDTGENLYYAMAGQASNNNSRSTERITINNDGTISLDTETIVHEVVISGPEIINNVSYYTFYDENVNQTANSTGYIYDASGSSSYLKTSAIILTGTNADKDKWKITIGNDGAATIVTKADLTRGTLKFNQNKSGSGSNATYSPLFNCYASGQRDVYLYVKVDDKDLELYSPTTLSSANEICVPANGSLTIQTNGSLTSSNAAYLIIEDGGELITHNAVQATVKKNIEEATIWGTGTTYTPDGWYFIASPVDGAAFPTGSVASQDIYQLDWANSTWLNLQNDTHSSLLAAGFQRGTGYLYASEAGNTLSVAGEIQPLSGDNDATVTLATTGWNLIGNPLTCKVTVDKDFSELNNGSSVENRSAGSAINPYQGIAVYGDAGTTVTFTKAATQNAAAPSNTAALQMTLAKNVTSRGTASTKVVDNTVVNFNSESSLPKFTMLEGSAKLYFPMEDADYAIVSSDGHGTMPVNFKAKEMGRYTISVETEGIDMSYLHLIDRLTGEDVNLLLDNEYSFIASNNDSEERFILSFTEKGYDAHGNEIFVYQSGNDLIVNGEGELQIFDVMGRMVKNTVINGVEAIAMPQGVYIFKLNGNVQKIVVR